MTSQEQDEADTQLHPQAAPRNGAPPPEGGKKRDDLGLSASNRAVTITLIIGIALMMLVLMLPYLSNL